jgi:hypothetical protein
MSEREIPREWQVLQYRDPRTVLLKFDQFEGQIADQNLPEDVRSLRVRSLRAAQYLRQAALFCYGMSHTSRLRVEFALFEDRDIDCVTRWMDGDTLHFCAVQLKELVPAHLNASADIVAELAKLSKYADARDLVVAFYVNREVHLSFPMFVPAKIGVSEVWFYGATSPDRRHWMLYGDVLATPTRYEFEYPS